MKMVWLIALMGAASGVLGQAATVDYSKSSTGTREFSSGALAIKILVEAQNLGSSEVEVGEITLPGNYAGGPHRHGAIEIFYVLEGTMEHVVNDVAHRLTAGMVGIVRPEDRVTHNVIGDTPVKAVVVWAPGGEVDRIRGAFPNERVFDGCL
ncbi:MAG: cupin domain-containing protein [Gammaproteobacteria bacterium]|nr:cupin domain-containing protein [Gammaproteobacteria bacterium]MCZ6659057.1 cupin domain-containing protein [Gammaproteobacteria bacterium]